MYPRAPCIWRPREYYAVLTMPAGRCLPIIAAASDAACWLRANPHCAQVKASGEKLKRTAYFRGAPPAYFPTADASRTPQSNGEIGELQSASTCPTPRTNPAKSAIQALARKSMKGVSAEMDKVLAHLSMAMGN
jgi:hypothetical protein